MDRERWQRDCKAILTSGAGLPADEWLEMAQRLSRDLVGAAAAYYDDGLYSTGTEKVASLREALVWTYVALKATPAEELQNYKDFDETTDIAAVMRRAVKSGFLYDGDAASIAGWMLWFAGVLRLLDIALAEQNVVAPPTTVAGAAGPHPWEVAGYGCFLVPIDHSARASINKPFVRRGLKFHAVIPTRIGNNSVTLHHHPHLRSPGRVRSRRPIRYAAGVFPGLEVDVSIRRGGAFLVERTVCPGAHSTIDRQIDCAREERCDVLMWPELTMPEGAVRQIEDRLVSEAISSMRKIALVLAGSFHVVEPEDGRHRNRTVILSGRGRRLATYDKRMKYRFRHEDAGKGPKSPLADRSEWIKPGVELPILVMEDRLVAVAICLDFCEDCDPPPYQHLNVDLVLVTSMGYRNTAEQHLEKARTLHTRHETEVFVVQQSPNVVGTSPLPASEAQGYSFLAPHNARSGLHIDQNEAFRAHGD